MGKTKKKFSVYYYEINEKGRVERRFEKKNVLWGKAKELRNELRERGTHAVIAPLCQPINTKPVEA